jgi:hypothetical protein
VVVLVRRCGVRKRTHQEVAAAAAARARVRARALRPLVKQRRKRRSGRRRCWRSGRRGQRQRRRRRRRYIRRRRRAPRHGRRHGRHRCRRGRHHHRRRALRCSELPLRCPDLRCRSLRGRCGRHCRLRRRLVRGGQLAAQRADDGEQRLRNGVAGGRRKKNEAQRTHTHARCFGASCAHRCCVCGQLLAAFARVAAPRRLARCARSGAGRGGRAVRRSARGGVSGGIGAEAQATHMFAARSAPAPPPPPSARPRRRWRSAAPPAQPHTRKHAGKARA